MIEFKRGNLLEEDAEALVNAVNTVGVMGKGIALAFKKKFPKNYTIYQQACSKNEMQIGRLLVTETELTSNPRFIINFPTKKHWKEKSRIEYIEMGLIDLVTVINEKHLQSVGIPALGCGLGGLDWQEVRPLILKSLEPVKNIQVIVFEPGETS